MACKVSQLGLYSSRAFKVDTLFKLGLSLFKKVQAELEPSFKIIEPSLEPLLSGCSAQFVYTPRLKFELGWAYKWNEEIDDFIEGFSLTLFIANRCEIYDFSLFEQNLQVGL